MSMPLVYLSDDYWNLSHSSDLDFKQKLEISYQIWIRVSSGFQQIFVLGISFNKKILDDDAKKFYII